MNSELKSIRRARGLAIWGLSVMSGVSPSLLTAIEKWGYVPGSNTQSRIADALGVQVEDIWTLDKAEMLSEENKEPGCSAIQEMAVQPGTEGTKDSR